MEILYAESDPDYRELVARILRSEDHFVHPVADGDEVLEFMRSSKPVDVLVVDSELPGMNGFNLLEAVRADRKRRHIPVVIFTAEPVEKTVLGVGAIYANKMRGTNALLAALPNR
jgi:CheY-like chemotaxis protein